MNISGIRIYAGFYDYNTIKNNEARSQQIEEARAEELALSEAYSEDTADKQIEEETAPKQQPEYKPDMGASEYAKQYRPDVVYDLKGIDSDIVRLDIEKALSDMKKDQVLQQYQFFVGEKKVGGGLTEYRENENFFL